MSSLDKKILQIIKKVKLRMHVAAILNKAVYFAAIALGVSLLLSIISLFFPIYGVYYKTALLVSIFVISGVLYGIFKGKPGIKNAAMKADAFDLKERAVTAVELAGDESPMAVLQKEDTLKRLEKVDYRKISLMPRKKYLLVCAVLGLLFVGTGFLPSPMRDKAIEQHNLDMLKQDKIQKVEKIASEIKKDDKLTKDQKKVLEQKLEELKKEIKTAEDKKEIDKALQRAEKKLEQDGQKLGGDKENLDKLMNELSKTEGLKNLAEALKSKDAGKVNEALKNLADSLKNMSPEQQKELAKKLKELAQNMKNNQELKNALENASSSIDQNGTLSRSDIDSLSKAMESSMKNSQMQESLESASEQLGEMQEGEGSQSSQGQEGQSSQSGQGGQNGQGSGGQGGQQGQNGQGQGGGGGAGNGTDMGNENQEPVSSDNQGISHKDPTGKKTGEYEKIFTSKNLGGDGQQTNLTGKKNNNGSTEVQRSNEPYSYKGESVPYDKVYGEYKDQAFESMNSSTIPDGMKEIVKGYFTSLGE